MWAWHLVWAGQRHHDVLLLDVAPAVEDREDGEEEEDVSPLEQEVVGVERLQQARGHDPEDQEVEGQPGDQEHAVPVPQPVTSQTGEKKNNYISMKSKSKAGAGVNIKNCQKQAQRKFFS